LEVEGGFDVGVCLPWHLAFDDTRTTDPSLLVKCQRHRCKFSFSITFLNRTIPF